MSQLAAKFERGAHFYNCSLRSLIKMAKKLHRSQSGKIIAGVAGGLADYFEIDSAIIRLLFIVIVAFGGSGILLYIILWLIMPQGPAQPAIINEEKIKEFSEDVKEKAQEFKADWQKKREEVKEETDKKKSGLFGWVLLILGIIFLFNNFMPYWMKYRILSYWPLLLIVVGITMIIKTNKK